MFRKRWFISAFSVLAALSLLASACGSSDSGDDGGAAEDAPADPNGVLRLSADLSLAAGIFFDLTTQVSVPAPWHPMIFDTLLRRTKEGGTEPGLAKEATIVDASTLKVELFPNVKFSDGTLMDAEAVKYGIERNITQGKSGSFETELYQMSSITVDSPTTLTIKLKTPIAGAWYRLLSLPETSPVSPTAAKNTAVNFNEHPVGAGPFMVKSFTKQDNITLVKNPTYFQADQIKLGGITYVHVTADAVTNALRSKTVDMTPALPYTSVANLQGSGVKTQVTATDNSSLIGHICKSRPPFDNLKVRQALNYAVDRDGLNALYDGKAEPMDGFFAKASPFHDAKLDGYYKYDLAKAKQLLAEAGATNLTFEVFYTPGADGQRAAEVLQQQLAKAGVTITLKQLTTQTDFFPDATKAPMYWFPLQRAGLNKITRVYVPGSYGNVCTWNDATLNDLVLKLQAVKEDSPEGLKLWNQIQERAFETAVSVFGLFTVQSSAWDDAKVANVNFLFIATSPVPDFYRIYIKK